MPVTDIILPPNLCGEWKYPGQGKSTYYTDYCKRYQRSGNKLTLPNRSYTSFVKNQKKLSWITPSVMQLTDHYPVRIGHPAALSFGYIPNQPSGNSQSSFYKAKSPREYGSQNGPREATTIPMQMLRSHVSVCPASSDEFLNHGSAFQPVRRADRGHFIIHSQFVSENTVGMGR